MKKTMTDEQVRYFIEHITRSETSDNPMVYLKAVRVTLYTLGYDHDFVHRLMNMIKTDPVYGVGEDLKEFYRLDEEYCKNYIDLLSGLRYASSNFYRTHINLAQLTSAQNRRLARLKEPNKKEFEFYDKALESLNELLEETKRASNFLKEINKEDK